MHKKLDEFRICMDDNNVHLTSYILSSNDYSCISHSGNQVITSMRKIVLCFLLPIGLQIQAQNITSVQNRIYGGDSLMIQQLDLEDFNLQGVDHTWNLKDVTQYKKKLKSRYIEKKDSIIGIELLNHVVYHQSKKGVSIVSIKDGLVQIDYDEPELYLKYPMKQGDSIAGQFIGHGVYCEQIPMQRYGTYITKTDSIGKIVLPNGKEIRGVIRVHTERLINQNYGDKLVDRTELQEDVYRWFADGYRYPILEAFVTTKDKKVIEEFLFYNDPEEQKLLASNDENKAIRDAVAKTGEEDSDHKKTRNEDHGFKYDISLNGQEITITYQTGEPAKIIALLANNQGHVYQRLEKKGKSNTGTINISTNTLRRGQYVVYLNVNGKSYSEKINIK